MNLGKVKTALTRNKTGLMVLGAGAVAGLALVARNRAAGEPDTEERAGAGSAVQAGALAPYDSTASDVYNAIQPQIEELRDLFLGVPVADPDPVVPAPASDVRISIDPPAPTWTAPRVVSGATVAKRTAPRVVSGATIAKRTAPRVVSGATIAKRTAKRVVSGATIAKRTAPAKRKSVGDIFGAGPRAVSGA